ncbi:hypothetical protein ACWD2L_06210 [Streptomyces sp. NPDC002754]
MPDFIPVASLVLYGGSIRDQHGEFIVEDTDGERYTLINFEGESLRGVRRNSIRPIPEEVDPS